MNFQDADAIATLDRLGRIFHENAVAHGFWPFKTHVDIKRTVNFTQDQIDTSLRNKGEMIALMHSELSECLEGIRKSEICRNCDGTGREYFAPNWGGCSKCKGTGKGNLDEHCPEFTSEEIKLADLLIRAMEYAYAFKLKLPEAILAKHEYNVTRPFKHGKAF